MSAEFDAIPIALRSVLCHPPSIPPRIGSDRIFRSPTIHIWQLGCHSHIGSLTASGLGSQLNGVELGVEFVRSHFEEIARCIVSIPH
ncbi:MAG: hypothetical protein DWH91_13370 [Planctomycetota bacterium]|nr:MAG: hypothetical protein DWH91_13370 [Planctomycetota bacterium]